MSAQTLVLNLATGEQTLWALPPEKAVVAAWEAARGKYNSWEYPDPCSHPEFFRNEFSVACGRTTTDTYSAMVNRRQRLPIREILADPVKRRELLINAARFIIATEGRDLSREELEELVDSTEPAHPSAGIPCHGSDPGDSATLSEV